MKQEIPKAYDPKKVEDKIYKAWEKSDFFNPDNLPRENIKKDKDGKELTYTIVLPPPNITSKLHLGHAAMLAIEDLLIRYHRMKGYRTLWIPGTDHAAIATQNVVEKKLLKEEKLTRHDLGREKFLKKVWEYLEETQAVILNQTRKMGASLDWSREAFTLDKQREKAVRKMFVDMYEAGVIYRGERIVNWCPRCHSTLADDEVEYKEQKAMLYTFKYSKDFPFTIATTRPETKLGDTAVAVNPKDKRYQKYIGEVYEVDFCGVKLKLKIIADRHVEMDFGTGALGVTPAHSMADWQMAEENNLEIIKVIGEDGKIRDGFGEYSNKSVQEAREIIVENLRKNNLLEKEEEIENNLSLCYRCGTAIEPLPSEQWFINVNKKLERLGGKSLKEKAIEVAKDKSIKFIPERFEKRYLDWMENLHDWCISRQIWFGHRIPVWYKNESGIKNQELRTWELKIYGKDIFNAIKENKKTIETRAGREKGTGKCWEDFKQGDVIKFSLADKKTDSIVESVAPVEKIVKKVIHFETIDEMLEALDLNKISPDSSVEKYKKTMESFPGFKKRLEKYGVWAIELKDAEDQEIYVGIKPPEGECWVQDEDSLDTWFSSGMWTFSTLGWPGESIEIIASRHGDTNAHKPEVFVGQEKEVDFDLNERGKRQAERLAEQLKNEKIDIIFSSDLKRTLQTAKIVNQYHSVKIIQDKHLREYRFGFMSGKTFKELQKKYPDIPTWKNLKINHRYLDEERPVEVKERVELFLNDIKKKYADKKIFVVTSGGVLDFFDMIANNKSFQNIKKLDHQKAGIERYIIHTDRDLKKFHPTQVLETGYEILTLWVSRMIIMSLFALKEIPFENVYLHGMVLDKHGKKMSKSKGNGIDPIEVIEKYGTDAVRLSLLIGSTPGNDVRFSEEKIEGQRNFVNKLWNIFRYIWDHFLDDDFYKNTLNKKTKNWTLADRWILSRMSWLRVNVTRNLDDYNFSKAGELLYDFTWNEFADWYIEVSKIEKHKEKDAVFTDVMNDLLKLWHPFMPFVTEEIWSIKNKNKNDEGSFELFTVFTLAWSIETDIV